MMKGAPAVQLPRPPMARAAQAMGLAMGTDNVFVDGDDRLDGVRVSGSGHVHFTVQAFLNADPKDGSMTDVITIEVEAADYLGALARAQQLFPGRTYRVASIREWCSKDPAIREG